MTNVTSNHVQSETCLWRRTKAGRGVNTLGFAAWKSVTGARDPADPVLCSAAV